MGTLFIGICQIQYDSVVTSLIVEARGAKEFLFLLITLYFKPLPLAFSNIVVDAMSIMTIGFHIKLSKISTRNLYKTLLQHIEKYCVRVSHIGQWIPNYISKLNIIGTEFRNLKEIFV